MIKEEWEVIAQKENFDALRNDEKFQTILILARIVNVLRFCQLSIIGIKDEDERPSAMRQRVNSFLYLTGILYEGLKVSRSMGKYFSDLKSFKDGFAVLFKDKKVKEFEEKVLNSIRNKVVSHFDKDVVKEKIVNFNSEEYIFATGCGPNPGETYYNLADEIYIKFITGNKYSIEEEHDEMKRIIGDSTEIMVKFIESAEYLIAEVLKEMGWAIRNKPNRT